MESKEPTIPRIDNVIPARETEKHKRIKEAISGAQTLTDLEGCLSMSALFGSVLEVKKIKDDISEIRRILKIISTSGKSDESKKLYSERVKIIEGMPRIFGFAKRLAEITDMSQELGVYEDISKLNEQ